RHTRSDRDWSSDVCSSDLGAPVDIIMTLPDGERLHLPGKVAYLGTGTTGDVGVRFDELPSHTQLQIQNYVDELAAGRTPQVPARSEERRVGKEGGCRRTAG